MRVVIANTRSTRHDESTRGECKYVQREENGVLFTFVCRFFVEIQDVRSSRKQQRAVLRLAART